MIHRNHGVLLCEGSSNLAPCHYSCNDPCWLMHSPGRLVSCFERIACFAATERPEVFVLRKSLGVV